MNKLLLLFISIIYFSPTSSQENSTGQLYNMLRVIEEVEIRQYKPLLFASYHSNSTLSDKNLYFRVLADYIFGANEKEEKIAMTSPVVIKLFNNKEMLFRMPANYTKKNIPKPNNKKIEFISTNYNQKAVIKYSGYSNEKKESKKIEELKTILDKNNIKHNNEFELFVYDPPYQFFNRRNEISVTILNED
tara:strand:- start:694 stop:1263 length:570 start_codon:yes stop_codon:yes gene_type:complete